MIFTRRTTTAPFPRSQAGLRRGSAYILVLGIAMLALVIGAGAIAVSRVEAQSAGEMGDIGAARLYALSGIELGRLMIANDPNWRTTRTNGAWVTDQSIKKGGSLTLEVVNPSGALNRSPSDSVVMTATGKAGKAQHKIQVTLATSSSAVSSLQAAVCAGGSISLNSSVVNGSNQLVASNGAVTAVLATVNANVEAVLTVTGLNYNGINKSLAAARQLPDATVFSYYTTNGTAISVSALDSTGGSGMKLRDCVLSPSNNPYGATKNAAGIYVIDCLGQQVLVSNCRIVGTLVLINPGAGSAVQGSVNWAPTGPGMPCLMVQGNIALSCVATVLNENVAPKTNYNPTGTPYPYPAGTADTDKTDTYPSMIDGLVFVSGNLTTSNVMTIDELIVGGTWSANGTLNLNYDPAMLQTPPPGFGGSGMSPVLGSWKQSVN